jgi:hypothetical protein
MYEHAVSFSDDKQPGVTAQPPPRKLFHTLWSCMDCDSVSISRIMEYRVLNQKVSEEPKD